MYRNSKHQYNSLLYLTLLSYSYFNYLTSAFFTVDNSCLNFAIPSEAEKGANLLGISMEDLFNTVFPEGPIGLVDTALDLLEGFVIGLYSITINLVVAIINKTISSPSHSMSSILLLDSPGFQNPSSCGVQTGASLSDLSHNYMQERLQQLFYEHALIEPRNRYKLELLDIDIEDLTAKSPGSLLELLEAIPQGCTTNRVKSSQNNMPDADQKGLFWLLHQETMKSKSSEVAFLEQLFTQYCDHELTCDLKRAAGSGQFILQHLQGTNPVMYSVNNWLKLNKESTATLAAANILQSSHLIRNSSYRSACLVGEGEQLRRISSIRRSVILPNNQRKSIMLQVCYLYYHIDIYFN